MWADSSFRQAPSYSAISIVNAASNQAGAYAPNTFITIYGANLAWTTRALGSGDVKGDTLPTVLPGTGVTVWVNNSPAHVYYVSPNQVNALLPSDLRPAVTQVRVQVDSTSGPPLTITLEAAAPAFFQMDAHTVIAAHADGSVVTADAPAVPGEYVVLYATGLGTTIPRATYGEIPAKAAPLADMANFGLTLDGVRIDKARIVYAGVAPGFAGLYQVNVQLPEDAGADPEIRLVVGTALSPAALHLPVRH